jgi:hypothetical protein
MVRHHLAFDPENRVGFGGFVIVKFCDGKISRSREYQYKSDMPWEEFSRF